MACFVVPFDSLKSIQHRKQNPLKFQREIFLNEPAECEALKATHLQGLDVPEFHSFTQCGDAAAPVRLDLFTKKQPEYNDQPIAVVSRDEAGVLNKVEIDPHGKRKIAMAAEEAKRVADKLALTAAAK